MAFQDVQIVIDVNKPGALTDLGTPLLLVVGTTVGNYKEFADADGVKEQYSDTHIAYKLAKIIENQGQYKPSKIAVATYTTGDEGVSAATVLGDVFDRDWYFVLSDVETVDEKKAISDVVKGQDLKMVGHLVTTAEDAQQLASVKYATSFAIGVEPETADEYANVAAVGAIGSRTVGSVTWKFKELTGVKPIENSTLALAYETANTNYYMNVNGKPHLRNGVMLSGDFIDSVHGQHWIKVNGQKAIQAVFFNQPKVPYTDSGIALLTTALQDILELAGRNGIVRQNDNGQYAYKINAISATNLTAAERASRKYSGLSFEYYEAGAIHEAKPIRGVVNF